MSSLPPAPAGDQKTVQEDSHGGQDQQNGYSSDSSSENLVAKALAPMPAYKAAGEIVLDFDGLLRPPVPPLRLHEDLKEGCGGQTWPAGMLLARHMLRHRQAEMADARILELGAGGGLVGLAVALNRSRDTGVGASSLSHQPPLYITDQLPMLALMEHNIILNGLQDTAKALILDWGNPLPQEIRDLRPTVVLAADCVYFEPAFPLLLATLTDLLALPTGADDATDNGPTIYFCFKKRRRADMQFLKQAQKRFCVTEAEDVERPVSSRQGLFLYEITRKKAKTAGPSGQAKAQKHKRENQTNGDTNGNLIEKAVEKTTTKEMTNQPRSEMNAV